MKYLISVLIIITFISGCSVFGIRSWEQPTYEILIEEGNYELRAYNSYVVAETVVSGTDFDEVSSKGFRVLADYIFGENYVRNSLLQESESISMTAPVLLNIENPKLVIRPPSDTINMTSPVIVDNLEEKSTKDVVSEGRLDRPDDDFHDPCLLYTSPSPRDQRGSG